MSDNPKIPELKNEIPANASVKFNRENNKIILSFASCNTGNGSMWIEMTPNKAFEIAKALEYEASQSLIGVSGYVALSDESLEAMINARLGFIVDETCVRIDTLLTPDKSIKTGYDVARRLMLLGAELTKKGYQL